MVSRGERWGLTGLLGVVGVNGVAGGLYMLAGGFDDYFPLEWLEGSPFSDYTIPGLALAVLIGGGSLGAASMLLLRHRLGVPAAALMGAMIVGFEVVEVLSVGSQPGIMRNLQIIVFSLGVVISALAGHLWLKEREAPITPRHRPAH